MSDCDIFNNICKNLEVAAFPHIYLTDVDRILRKNKNTHENRQSAIKLINTAISVTYRSNLYRLFTHYDVFNIIELVTEHYTFEENELDSVFKYFLDLRMYGRCLNIQWIHNIVKNGYDIKKHRAELEKNGYNSSIKMLDDMIGTNEKITKKEFCDIFFTFPLHSNRSKYVSYNICKREIHDKILQIFNKHKQLNFDTDDGETIFYSYKNVYHYHEIDTLLKFLDNCRYEFSYIDYCNMLDNFYNSESIMLDGFNFLRNTKNIEITTDTVFKIVEHMNQYMTVNNLDRHRALNTIINNKNIKNNIRSHELTEQQTLKILLIEQNIRRYSDITNNIINMFTLNITKDIAEFGVKCNIHRIIDYLVKNNPEYLYQMRDNWFKFACLNNNIKLIEYYLNQRMIPNYRHVIYVLLNNCRTYGDRSHVQIIICKFLSHGMFLTNKIKEILQFYMTYTGYIFNDSIMNKFLNMPTLARRCNIHRIKFEYKTHCNEQTLLYKYCRQYEIYDMIEYILKNNKKSLKIDVICCRSATLNNNPCMLQFIQDDTNYKVEECVLKNVSTPLKYLYEKLYENNVDCTYDDIKSTVKNDDICESNFISKLIKIYNDE